VTIRIRFSWQPVTSQIFKIFYKATQMFTWCVCVCMRYAVCHVLWLKTCTIFSFTSSSRTRCHCRETDHSSLLFSSQFISLHINLLLQWCVTCQCSALIENCAEASQNPIRSGLKSILMKRSHSNKGLYILC